LPFRARPWTSGARPWTKPWRLGSEHLSSYEVIYEEDTPLYAQLNAGEFDVDEDLACDMFEELVQRSATAGFRPITKLPTSRAMPAWGNPLGRAAN